MGSTPCFFRNQTAAGSDITVLFPVEIIVEVWCGQLSRFGTSAEATSANMLKLQKSHVLSDLAAPHCECGVTHYHPANSHKSKLSTDRHKCSSVSTGCIALACCLLLAVGTLQSAASEPSQTQNSDGKTATGQTVGQRLAADLIWTQAERDRRFRRMDLSFPVHTVPRGRGVRPLPKGQALDLRPDVLGRYMQSEHLAGVLVLQDGRIRAERYALGLMPAGLWTTFSVTKALTDTLAGMALRQGSLHSLGDDVAGYLPEMRGSAYEGVTVRQLMTMTSGVRWHENYTSPTADNVLLYSTPVAAGLDPVVEYMRQLPREAVPGTRWQYNTGETDLLGVLLRRATGKNLAEQLSRVWRSAGMQADANWIATATDPAGEEFGGSGVSATLHDLGRFGQWVLEGGHGVVSPTWFAEATRAQVQAGSASYGYGWWPQGDGSFAALGIFGQSIFVDPKRQLVIVCVGDWAEATGAAHTAARTAYWRQVQAAVDLPAR